MSYYRDLRDYLQVLEKAGKLVRVTAPVNKDTEMHPLVRWQFRGLPEKERKAFFFENVVDVKGKKYDIPVVVACHAASREMYAMGMMCPPGGIVEKWLQAELHPVPPVRAGSGPVQEEVHAGDGLLDHGGVAEFPVPISTPGFDPAPFLTAANWVTRDPETGVYNIGNYRAMLKAPDRLGIWSPAPQQDLGAHWLKCRQRGIPLQAAIVLGAPPNIGYVATAKLPYGMDEYGVAGGIAGQPVELVKCRTVDLEVPASAEIVIEGVLPTDVVELEAPFGEFPGYMGPRKPSQFMNVTCITHRKNPILNAFLSQFPPSESSKLRGISLEAALFKFLTHDCAIQGVIEVALPECSGASNICVVRMKKGHPAAVMQALNGVMTYNTSIAKFAIAVDEDIDAGDIESVNWALSFRVQPHRDIRMVTNRTAALDPSAAPPGSADYRYPPPAGNSAMLIDATMKWDYPPTSLPRKDFMEHARKLWQDLGLPAFTPKAPWYGYSLGAWSKENEEEAELALRGEHFQTGEKLKQKRLSADHIR